jgi:hypothetical protein
MNIPTVGRRVWYHPLPNERFYTDSKQPFDAGIAHVHTASCVNLSVQNDLGEAMHGKTSVRLVQAPEDAQPGEASWMDYHVAQDKKVAQPNG